MGELEIEKKVLEYEKENRPWPGWKIRREGGIPVRLGVGGFGIVYEICQEFSGIRRCMKVIEVTGVVNPRREIIVQASLAEQEGSRNIVKIEDCKALPDEENPELYFIRMELLKPIMAGNGRLARTELESDWREVLKLAEEIGQALKLAHGQKEQILHRDVKPDNVMYDSKNGCYKLGDFGVASILEKGQQGRTAVGTRPYQAPEIITHAYDYRADIYSYGIMLYYLLNDCTYPCCEKPWRITEEDLIRRYQAERLPEPRHGSKLFKELVVKACANAPDKRYQSMDELLADLEKVRAEAEQEKEKKADEENLIGKILQDAQKAGGYKKWDSQITVAEPSEEKRRASEQPPAGMKKKVETPRARKLAEEKKAQGPAAEGRPEEAKKKAPNQVSEKRAPSSSGKPAAEKKNPPAGDKPAAGKTEWEISSVTEDRTEAEPGMKKPEKAPKEKNFFTPERAEALRRKHGLTPEIKGEKAQTGHPWLRVHLGSLGLLVGILAVFINVWECPFSVGWGPAGMSLGLYVLGICRKGRLEAGQGFKIPYIALIPLVAFGAFAVVRKEPLGPCLFVLIAAFFPWSWVNTCTFAAVAAAFLSEVISGNPELISLFVPETAILIVPALLLAVMLLSWNSLGAALCASGAFISMAVGIVSWILGTLFHVAQPAWLLSMHLISTGAVTAVGIFLAYVLCYSEK